VVGIVLVSHSRALAQSLVPFLREMAGPEIRITIAAGIDEKTFGTDATEIARSIRSADQGDGVIVFVDIGSAVMSAEMALDFLDEEIASRTVLSSAPLVEGAVSAAVAASGGASLSDVVEETGKGLHQKESALSDQNQGQQVAEPSTAGTVETSTSDATDRAEPNPSDGPPHSTPDASTPNVSTPNAPAPEEPRTPDASARVQLVNEHGLHARPAARFVRSAAEFIRRRQPDEGEAADVFVQVVDETTGKGPVNATSLSEITTLGAGEGHTLLISAGGPESEAIIDQLVHLVESGFAQSHEATSAASTSTPPSPSPEVVPASEMVPASEPASAETLPYDESLLDGSLSAVSVQTGIALAPAYVHRPRVPDIPQATAEDPAQEWSSLNDALDTVRRDMDVKRSSLVDDGQNDAADILGAQQLLLEDPALCDRARQLIYDETLTAASAWTDAVEHVIDTYTGTDDAYLSQRADDVRDVSARVIHALLEIPPTSIESPAHEHVLITPFIRPSDVPELDESVTRAVVSVEGSPFSHSAILLRGQGIPTLFHAPETVLTSPDQAVIGVDAFAGRLWLDPSPGVRNALQARAEAEQEREQAAQRHAQDPAETTNGTHIQISANVSNPSDVPLAQEKGADGIGLLRTEFLFSGMNEAPSEDEQFDTLLRATEAFQDRPITLRAMDVGGDKPLPYLPLPDEQNPFLGLRGIRVLLQHPEFFARQIRATLRLAAVRDLQFMVPMVTHPGEMQQVRTLVQRVRDDIDLDAGSLHLPLGTMIETPASALLADRLVDDADFFSIGTNDLAQYTMAADREHGGLGDLTDALHPPVLRLIRHTVEAAQVKGRPVSVCGEIAADHEAVPILLGLGVRHLSMRPSQIPATKALVRTLDLDDCRSLAEDALAASDAVSVRTLSRQQVPATR